MFQIEALDHVGLIVQNMERAVQWYREVLGMDGQARPGSHGNRKRAGSAFPTTQSG